MANQTQDIANAYTYEVNFTTTNLSNGDPFVEPHEVTGPNPISVSNPLNTVFNGSQTIAAIPLTTNTSQGAHYLILVYPQPGSSKMYVAFGQKNSNYSGGYYYYTQGMTDAYRTDYITFCKDGALSAFGTTTTFNKKVKFVVKGIDTNNVSAAVEFQVWFRYTQTSTPSLPSFAVTG